MTGSEEIGVLEVGQGDNIPLIYAQEASTLETGNSGFQSSGG